MRPGLPAPLIELLGARWSMGAPVVGAAWLAGGEGAAFGLADGTIAIARARWDGAAQVQPRAGGGVELVPASAAPPPVMRVGVHAGPCLAIAAVPIAKPGAAAGAGSVLSGGADGRFAAIAADGTVETLARLAGARIDHVAAAANGSRACAVGTRVHRFGVAPAVLELSGPVAALAFAPDGRLAIADAAGVTLWPDAAASRAPEQLAAPGIRALAWDAAGQVLVAGLQDGACGWRLPAGDRILMDATPSPLLSYSAPGGFFAVSGNARVVCWRMAAAAGAATRSECGVGSAVVVTQVACHPRLAVIAAGYANGAVLLCQPDSTELLFVRPAGGGAIATLAWSPDGAFLALGAAGGEIGVVAFPEPLFRAAPPPPPSPPPPAASRGADR